MRQRALGFNSATAVTPWMTFACRPHFLPKDALQFGHGGDAVDDGRGDGGLLEKEKLQFGHGGDAVDDPARAVYNSLRDQRFNSATAVTPWMTAIILRILTP